MPETEVDGWASRAITLIAHGEDDRLVPVENAPCSRCGFLAPGC